MAGFIPELIERAGSHGKTVVLAMDQSKISEGFECLMISLRVAERAIPVVKSRGFGITKTHLKHPDRIEKLILLLTISLYWALSTGMKPKLDKNTQKNAIDL